MAQDAEFDGGSPVVGYEVEMQPKCKAAKKGMFNDWLLVYQVGRTGMCVFALHKYCSPGWATLLGTAEQCCVPLPAVLIFQGIHRLLPPL